MLTGCVYIKFGDDGEYTIYKDAEMTMSVGLGVVGQLVLSLMILGYHLRLLLIICRRRVMWQRFNSVRLPK